MFGPFSVEKGEKYHITECYLVWNPANRLPFRGQDMMDVLTSVVLSHFHIASMFLSVLKINLAPFLQEDALNDNIMRNNMLINFGIKGDKIGMLHKIKGKSLIFLGSPSPSPIVLLCCFIQEVLPNPPSPFIFHIGCNT